MNIQKVQVMSAPPRAKGGSPRPEARPSVQALFTPAKNQAGRRMYPKYQRRVDQRTSPLLPFAAGVLIALTAAAVWYFGFARPAAQQAAAAAAETAAKAADVAAAQPASVVSQAQPALAGSVAAAIKPAVQKPAPKPAVQQPAAQEAPVAAAAAVADKAAGDSVEARMANMVAPRAALASEIKIHLEQYYQSITGMPVQMYLAEREPILNTYFSGDALKAMQALERERVEYERVRDGAVLVSVLRVSKDGLGAVVTLQRKGVVVDVHSTENAALLAGAVKQSDTTKAFYVEYDTELGRWKFARELPEAKLPAAK